MKFPQKIHALTKVIWKKNYHLAIRYTFSPRYCHHHFYTIAIVARLHSLSHFATLTSIFSTQKLVIEIECICENVDNNRQTHTKNVYVCVCVHFFFLKMKIRKEAKENWVYCWKEYEIFKLQYAFPRCAYSISCFSTYKSNIRGNRQ